MVKKKASKRKTATRKTTAKKAATSPRAAPTAQAAPATVEPTDTIDPKDKADLLLNHYNDTFGYLWKHWLVRNRLFFYLLVLLFLMAVEVASRDSLTSLVTAYLSGKLKTGSAPPPVIQFEIISSASWFALLCLVIHYFQRSLQVDRQYQYLADVEERLCGLLGERAIYREGDAYWSAKGQLKDTDVVSQDERPLFIKWIGAIYTIFFPVMLILLVVLKLWWESRKMGITLSWEEEINWAFTFDFVIGAIIVGYTVAYIRNGGHLSQKRIDELFGR
jgi:hypothetical protein